MIDRIRARVDAGRQDGFTLIELLIVIIILGVLAGIVVFAVGGVSDKSKSAACKSDLKSVETAVEAYRASKGKYPDGADSNARFGQLTTSGSAFLKSKPSSPDYSIEITDTSGTVVSKNAAGTAALDCATL